MANSYGIKESTLRTYIARIKDEEKLKDYGPEGYAIRKKLGSGKK